MKKIYTPDTAVTFENLHTQILDSIKTNITGFNVVSSYDKHRLKLETPACLLECTGLTYDAVDSPLTEQVALNVSFTAHVVAQSEIKQIDVRTLALDVAILVNNNRWGLPADPANLISIETESFAPVLENFYTWSVLWTQLVYFKKSIFYKDNFKPKIVNADFKING